MSNLYNELSRQDLVKANITDLPRLTPSEEPYAVAGDKNYAALDHGWEVLVSRQMPPLKQLTLVNHLTGQRLHLEFEPLHKSFKLAVEITEAIPESCTGLAFALSEIPVRGNQPLISATDVDGQLQHMDLDRVFIRYGADFFIRADVFIDQEQAEIAFDDYFGGNLNFDMVLYEKAMKRFNILTGRAASPVYSTFPNTVVKGVKDV